jgi:hypothetical protein
MDGVCLYCDCVSSYVKTSTCQTAHSSTIGTISPCAASRTLTPYTAIYCTTHFLLSPIMAIASTPDHTETMDEVRALQRALAVDFKTPSENQTDQLQGKTLLVTGGASGFGRQS